MTQAPDAPGDYQLGVMHGQILSRLDALDQRWGDHITENAAFKKDVLERLETIEHGVNGGRGTGVIAKYRADALAGTSFGGVLVLGLLELLGKL